MKRLNIAKIITIPKNRKKKVDEIFAEGYDCKVYSLSNGFVGKKCDVKYAKKELYEFRFCKLRFLGNEKYNVDVHSNLWYEFKSSVLPK